MRGRRLARVLVVLLGAAAGLLALSGLASAQVRSPFGPPALGPPGLPPPGALHAQPLFRPPPLPAPASFTAPIATAPTLAGHAARTAAVFAPPSPALAPPAPTFGAQNLGAPFLFPGFVGGQNSALFPVAISGPAIGGNIGVINAGPVGGIANQIGNNIVVAPQFSSVTSGHAIAGSQVTGLPFFGPSIFGSNSAILPIALSGPAIGGNIGLIGAGPAGLLTGQVGNNIVLAPQFSHVGSGHAIAGSQVSGLLGGLGFSPWSAFSPFSAAPYLGAALPYSAYGLGHSPLWNPHRSLITADAHGAAVIGPRGASLRHGRSLHTYGPAGVISSTPQHRSVLGPNGLIADHAAHSSAGHHARRHHTGDGSVVYSAFGAGALPYYGSLWQPAPWGLPSAYSSLPYLTSAATLSGAHAARTAAHLAHRRTLDTIHARSYLPYGAYGYAPYGHRTAWGYPSGYPGAMVTGPFGSYIGSPFSHMVNTPLGSAIASPLHFQANTPLGSVIAGPLSYQKAGPLGSVIASPRGVMWSVPFLGSGIVGFPYALLI